MLWDIGVSGWQRVVRILKGWHLGGVEILGGAMGAGGLGGVGGHWGLSRYLGSAPGSGSPITDSLPSHSESPHFRDPSVFGVPQALQWPSQGAPVRLQVQLWGPDRLRCREGLIRGPPRPGFLHQERPEGEGTPTLPQSTKASSNLPGPPNGGSFCPSPSYSSQRMNRE